MASSFHFEHMTSPVMDVGYTLNAQNISKTLRFPSGSTFYHLINGTRAIGEDTQVRVQEVTINLLEEIPIYIRGGYIIPYQNITEYTLIHSFNKVVVNTNTSRTRVPVDLIAALESNRSDGYFRIDGTEMEFNEYRFEVTLTAEQGLKVTIEKTTDEFD